METQEELTRADFLEVDDCPAKKMTEVEFVTWFRFETGIEDDVEIIAEPCDCSDYRCHGWEVKSIKRVPGKTFTASPAPEPAPESVQEEPEQVPEFLVPDAPATIEQTQQGAKMSKRQSRLWTFIRVERGLPLTDWSTSAHVRAYDAKLREAFTVARERSSNPTWSFVASDLEALLARCAQAPAVTEPETVEPEQQAPIPEADSGYVLADGAAAGAIVYWPHGAALGYEEVLKALAALPDWMRPKPPSKATALRLVMYGFRDREVSVESRDSVWVVFQKSAEKAVGESAGTILGRAWFEDGEVKTEGEHFTAEQITERLATQMGILQMNEVSSWLTGVVRKMDGTILRDGGGFYYLPQHSMERTDKLKAALATLGFVMHKAPSMKCADFVAMVLDGLSGEVARRVDELREQVQGCKGEREAAQYLQHHMAKWDAIDAKVKMYERFLGTQLAVEAKAEMVKLGEELKARRSRGALLEVD